MTTESKIKKLIELLEKAEHLASQFSAGYSGEFLSAEEFHKALSNSITKYKNGDNAQLEELQIWFLPTSCWDDFIGFQDEEGLGDEINYLLDKVIMKTNRT